MVDVRKSARVCRRSLLRLRRRVKTFFRVSNETYEMVSFTAQYWKPHMKLIIFSISAMLCATLLSVIVPLAANEVATYTGPTTSANDMTSMSNKPNTFQHDDGASTSLQNEKYIGSMNKSPVVKTNGITNTEKNTKLSETKLSEKQEQQQEHTSQTDTVNSASGISSIIGRLSEIMFLRFLPFRQHVEHGATHADNTDNKLNTEVLKHADKQMSTVPATFQEGLLCRCLLMAFSVLMYHIISLCAHLSAYYASISTQSTMTESTLLTILHTPHPERIAVVSPVKLAQVIRYCAKTSGDILAGMLTDGVSSIFTSIALLLALVYISFRLTFIIGILVTVVQYIYILAGQNQHLQSAAVSAEESHVQAYLTNALTRSETIFVFGCHNFVMSRFHRKLTDLQGLNNWLNVSIHGLAAISTGSITLIFVVVLGLCNYYHRRGDLALMDIALYFLFLQQFVNRLQQISRDFSVIRATLGRLETLRNLLTWYSEEIAIPSTMLSPYITNDLVRTSTSKGNIASITTTTTTSSTKGSDEAIANGTELMNGQNATNRANNIVSNSTTPTTNTLSIASSDDKMVNRIYSTNSLLSMQDAPMKPAPQVIQSDDGDAAISLEEVSFIYPQVPSFIAEVSVCSANTTNTDHSSNTILNNRDDNAQNETNKIIFDNSSSANGEVTGMVCSSLVNTTDAAAVMVTDKRNNVDIHDTNAINNHNNRSCDSMKDEHKENKFKMEQNDVQATNDHGSNNNIDSPNHHGKLIETSKISYSPPIRGIRKMSVSAMPHKITALFGHSGCGKSTCLRLFSGLVTPQEGVVRTHKHVVLLEQSHAIFIGSVAENILLQNLEMPDSDTYRSSSGTKNNTKRNDNETIRKKKHDAKDNTSSEANNNNNNTTSNSNNSNKEKRKWSKLGLWRLYDKWRQLTQWRLWRRIIKKKKKKSTPTNMSLDPFIRSRVNRAVVESGCASFLLDPFTAYIENVEHPPFSGGQLQRICLARVFGVNTTCTLVLLDEPTTGLDPQSVELLLGTIKDLRDVHHKTVIISTHDNRVAEIADNVIYLSSPKVCESFTLR